MCGPIVDHLNASIPQARFGLEASRNYEEFDKKLFSSYFDFAIPNPYQTVRSLEYVYRVFSKMGDDELFRGIILVRKDSGICKVSELKGKKVSYPALTALAATWPVPWLTFQRRRVRGDAARNQYRLRRIHAARGGHRGKDQADAGRSVSPACGM